MFEELDHRETPIGALSLRRRVEPNLDVEVYEVKLDEEFLMSSLFTASEVALARLGLAAVAEQGDLDVVVGGLGLGYTAREVLDDDRVRSLGVVEFLGAVIDWHRDGRLPMGDTLATDPRSLLIEGDFFALVEAGNGFGSAVGPFHAVLVDIDHSTHHHLGTENAGFYTESGLAQVRRLLHPGGVFGLWSDDPPDEAFITAARRVFDDCRAEVIRFPTPYGDGESACTVYVATA